ncbi:MAG: efflux RND transporter permease subunit [Alphaproteobacteria bacterium]|nr:efflux RND transporter permease subunit [Alphaproteobacteria bacterium]
MRDFNLSAWALRQPALVRYAIVVLALAGVWAYFALGKAEDPSFTIKTMVVRTFWPGATAREVELQVSDRLEKKLQEVPYFDFVVGYARAGESVIFVNLKEDVPPKEVNEIWYQVRKRVSDIRGTLPEGIVGPYFNDEFGDTFGTVYAFTADGFTHAELRDAVEDVRRELLRVPNVGKVELFGVQPEKIYVEFSNRKLATLGIDPQIILQTLQRQNAMAPSGTVETASDKVFVRVTGDFDSVEQVKRIGVQAGGRIVRLGDIAEVRRGSADPPQLAMRYRGEPAIGLGVSLAKGGDIIAMGERLEEAMARILRDLPVGIDVHKIHDQPRVVVRSFTEFMQSLAEAVGIVLLVSFLSLGLRTGLVVALSIPLVLAITFICMKLFGIDFQRISLGALIIALGLLVDDAIIAVEMMVVKMEQGWDRIKAASFAYTSTAFPMLTGTLITAAGFVPVGFARSNAGEYTFSIFAVVTIALLVSWIVAVIFTPYIGVSILPDFAKGRHQGHDVYGGRFYRLFRAVVEACVRFRWTTIVVTVLAFLASVWGFGFVQQQFFPSANRPELIVDLRLATGASVGAAGVDATRMEALLKDDPDVVDFATYVGGGTPRFYLPIDAQQPQANLAQIVINARDNDARERIRDKLIAAFEADFDQVRGRVNRLENGPPVGFPVQFRVSGDDPDQVRRHAEEVKAIMAADPNTSGVHLDWNELSKVVRIEVDQDKARVLGISSQDLSFILNSVLSGVTITQYREGKELIDVVARAGAEDRLSLAALRDIHLAAPSGRAFPLSQVATIRYELEEGVIWRRDRQPTITVRADIVGDVQAPVVSMRLDPRLDEVRKRLPPGYRIAMGGAAEASAKSQDSIKAVVPVMIFLMVTLLMLQLRSFQRAMMVALTGPLGLIGVTTFLLAFDRPFGFVAMLGVIALAGMIMRNSVILVDQIETDIADGIAPFEAIIGSAVRRFRPIMLTALAAILAMIPLARSVFWGPMALAIMGGLLVATVLTLLFLPALYATWFRIPAPKRV